jgi:hypothetical protein
LSGPAQATAAPERNLYLDALRAGALMVVVFGHWIATLPRIDEGEPLATEHMLNVWRAAGYLTWVVQVVPLFVFVSAAVSADGVARRMADGHQQMHWWAGRALALARPAVTYLAVIAVFAVISLFTGGALLQPFNLSLTVHLWFLLMLLSVQAFLPLSVAADRRWGLGAVIGLVMLAALMDLLRALPASISELLQLGEAVTEAPAGIAWLNVLLVWLLPQQLGIAWRNGRFRGAWVGIAFLLLGALWLIATVTSGYPVAMVGVDLDGNSNMLPPTLALIGVMWLQVGAVLLCERPGRWLLDRERVSGLIGWLSALSLPLYLWHKLAELPAAWVGQRLQLSIDAGLPGEPGFWAGRLWWLLLCSVMVVPVLAAVVAFEIRRARDVMQTTRSGFIVAGGTALFAGLVVSLVLGTMPGAVIGLVGVAAASWLLRVHSKPAR